MYVSEEYTCVGALLPLSSRIGANRSSVGVSQAAASVVPPPTHSNQHWCRVVTTTSILVSEAQKYIIQALWVQEGAIWYCDHQ